MVEDRMPALVARRTTNQQQCSTGEYGESSAGMPRRYARRLGGRRLACGYDLRGDLERGCPECGWRREVAS